MLHNIHDSYSPGFVRLRGIVVRGCAPLTSCMKSPRTRDPFPGRYTANHQGVGVISAAVPSSEA